uniref:Phosphatidylcholine transfer protein n=1 Tax=Arcella intermedia TaxID=1963864 RepID=A0A6B2LIZ2_9EUKA
MDKLKGKFDHPHEHAPQGWDEFFNDLGVKVYRKLKQGTQFKYRTFGVIQCPASEYFSFYKDLDNWRKWDENVDDLSIIERQTEAVDIVYWSVKFPFPLSNRDYIYRRHAKYYDSHKMWVISCRTCEHDSKKPSSKRVRVTNYKMVQVLRESDNGMCQTFIEHYDDPQINAPSWLLNWVTKTAIPKFMSKLTVECKKYIKQKK